MLLKKINLLVVKSAAIKMYDPTGEICQTVPHPNIKEHVSYYTFTPNMMQIAVFSYLFSCVLVAYVYHSHTWLQRENRCGIVSFRGIISQKDSYDKGKYDTRMDRVKAFPGMGVLFVKA